MPWTLPLFLPPLPLTRPFARSHDHLSTRAPRPPCPHRTSAAPARCATSMSRQSPSELWERIRLAVPIRDAFADLVGADSIKQTGPDTYKLRCPFHPDKNPSLQLYATTNSFHCFGCSASGSIIDLERLRTGNESVPNALRSLAVRYPAIADLLPSVSPPRTASAPTLAAPPPLAPAKRPRKNWGMQLRNSEAAYAVLRVAEAFYEERLWADDGAPAREYLAMRGLSEKTIRAFGLGYAPPAPPWDALLAYLKRQGHPSEHAVLAGVARVREDGAAYDVHRGRVITPIRSLGSVPVGLAGRLLPGVQSARSADRAPKYLNGPETPVFSKGEVLYGSDLAKGAELAKGIDGFVVVVEGYMDVLAMYEHTNGRVACVASMGTALSHKQLYAAYKLLEDSVDGKVIVNLDGDEAGIVAVERLCESVIPKCTCASQIYIAMPPPEVKDAGEFFEGYGSGDDYIEYLMEVALLWYEWCGRRIVLEEVELLNNEELEGEHGRDSVGLEEGGDPVVERTMMRLDPSQQSLEIQISEDLKQVSDELVVAFGGPKSLLSERGAEKQELYVCAEVVEDLARLIDKTQRCVPGLNVGMLVHSWADTLSRGNILAYAPTFKTIIKRAEQLGESWKHLSPVFQLQWMSPPPWVVEELPKRKRRSVLEASGIEPSGAIMDAEAFVADKRRVRRSNEIIKAQEASLMPYLEEQRSKQAKRLEEEPRAAAEEVILRALVFASELSRLDALEKLLEVVMRCEEKEIPFWTSQAREGLFEYLAQAEGPLSSEQMAASLESEDWWIPEIEDLFVPIEEETDMEWKSLRMLEIDNPVDVVASTAISVEIMAGLVGSRLAVEETVEIARKLGSTEEEYEQEEVERLIAQQIKLKKAVNKTKFFTPEQDAEWQKTLEDARREKEESATITKILEELETSSIPYPKHFKPRDPKSDNRLGLPDDYKTRGNVNPNL